MKVTLIGIGMEGKATLTKQAEERIHSASVLIGAVRMLTPFGQLPNPQINCSDMQEISRILHESWEKDDGHPTAVVLLSGDTGFYSGARSLLPLLSDMDVEVMPGISSLSYFCAKTGLTYEDMQVVSLHGREDRIAVHVIRNEKTFFLLGGSTDAAALCRRLCRYGLPNVIVHIGENLGMVSERVTTGTAQELRDIRTEYLSVVIVENPHALRFLPTGIPDDAFSRVTSEDGGRTIPMTKSEVRAVAVGKLNIGETDVCWDVGCGTGSVAVEMAYRCPHGRVCAFDRNTEAVALTMHNAETFGCDNITAVSCVFPPEKTEGMPVPDRVFIGGSSGKIAEIVSLALALNPDVKIVVTAVSLETLEEAHAALSQAYEACEVTQLSVARATQNGRVSMFLANNPVFILKGIS